MKAIRVDDAIDPKDKQVCACASLKLVDAHRQAKSHPHHLSVDRYHHKSQASRLSTLSSLQQAAGSRLRLVKKIMEIAMFI